MKEIFSRRSVRKFTEEPVSDADLECLFRAAMNAPSAGNEQPWEFIVTRKRENLLKITEFHTHAKMLQSAACAILICGNLKRRKYLCDFWVQDCSAAAQNLLLEAEHLGLGAVWLGVYPLKDRIKDCQELFGLEENVIPFAFIAIGHPDEKPGLDDKYQPERVRYFD